MGKTAKIIKAFAMMATLMFCAWSTVRIVKAVQFNMTALSTSRERQMLTPSNSQRKNLQKQFLMQRETT